MGRTVDKRIRYSILALLAVVCLLVAGCAVMEVSQEDPTGAQENPAGAVGSAPSAALDDIPPYAGNAYVTIHDNQPEFGEEDRSSDSFETYEELDRLGRCGTAYANIGQDLMPTEKRGNISPIKPSGWQSAKYDCVEGKYLYNRCHLIGFQLSGENANKRNLITGTRYLNVEGMLPFENQVAEYVRTTGNHVLYRVTPVYEGDNLVADGVQMEAKSVEDNGTGVCFNIFAYNIQPGITIDYATGESHLTEDGGAGETNTDEAGTSSSDSGKTEQSQAREYVLNTNTRKYHLPSCSGVRDMNKENRENYTGTKSELEDQGYEACGRCKP